MKIVKEITEDLGEATLNLVDGTKRKVITKTIYTYYTDGTNDCEVKIQKPLDMMGKSEEVI